MSLIDYILDHILDHVIISFVTMTLHLFKFASPLYKLFVCKLDIYITESEEKDFKNNFYTDIC